MVNPVRQGQFPTQFRELFVSSMTGDDAAEGSHDRPFKTLTRALQSLDFAMTTIRLSPGTYSAESGEVFPLQIPDRVSVSGDATGQGQAVIIRGGGEYDSPTFGPQSIAIRMGDTTLLNGVTVTNPSSKGTGIWIEAVATIANCRILDCGREGIFATDTASLAIVDCLLQGNRASGISLVRHAKGQIRRSLHQGNSFGLVLSDYAAPLVIDSQFLENRTGLLLSGAACPVLRNNRIEHNQRDGLTVLQQALPDLGHPQDPGHNLFQDNGVCDLRNATSIALRSVGNDLTPWQTVGAVTFVTSQIRSQTPSRLPGPTSRLRHPKLKPVLTPPRRVPPPALPFTIADLIGHWAEPLVCGLLSQWRLNTFLNSLFEPDRPISRAEYTTWLIKTFNLPPKRSLYPFADVPADYWAVTAITQAQCLGFIDAFPDQTFRPAANLTRLQAITSLVQGLELRQGNPEVLQAYRDRAQIPSWAVGAVASATQQRLIVSQTEVDRLRPLESITRAELAAMLYQGLVYLGQSPAIASSHIVSPVAVASFSDIQDHWAAEWIRGLTSYGLMQGTTAGKFEPDRPMTRAAYAGVLAQALRPRPERPAKVFADVNLSTVEMEAIDRVYRGRLMGGFADDTFRPHQPVTRAQVLLSLVSGLKSPGADLALLDRFTDAETIPSSARKAIAAATAQWLVVTPPDLTQLRPNQAATRAEVAAMVYQALVRLGQATAIPSPYLIDPRYPNQPTVFRVAPIVVLDPGHGGADLGVISRLPAAESESDIPRMLDVIPEVPLREKDIVLPIAQDIATQLQQQGIQVLLTRSSDRYVDAATRINLAERVAADLLISLHINATAPDNATAAEVNGLETYYSPHSESSKTLAHTIHAAVLQSLDIADRQVHPAYFYGLRSASMPAIHIEMGYITGTKDAANLANPDYCQQMAAAIVDGILQYSNFQLS
jgi:N-acetylmuramoyl-L-alanine amidase